MTTLSLTAATQVKPKARRTWSTRDAVIGVSGMALTVIALMALMRGGLGISEMSLWRLPPAVLFHIFTIVPAIPLGAYVFVARKGTKQHRLAGRIWCLLMFATAISTIFIRTSPDGAMSWIHTFTFMTMASIPLGIWAAMTRRYKLHERVFLQLYIGAVLVAGGFTFLPGRTMFQLAFG
ncbi:MAG: DUF2306 domain-containing protein [Pacificimonas sp.]